MLTHPTREKLFALRLTGMLKALQDQQHTPDIEALGFEERLGPLVDREFTKRDSRRLGTRLRKVTEALPMVREFDVIIEQDAEGYLWLPSPLCPAVTPRRNLWTC
jgi:hypothetical protein